MPHITRAPYTRRDTPDARGIVAWWAREARETTGVPVPRSKISAAASITRRLIAAGYTTAHIKTGLRMWLDAMSVPGAVDSPGFAIAAAEALAHGDERAARRLIASAQQRCA